MPYQSVLYRNLLLVLRWDIPTAADVDEICDAIAAAAQARGAPILSVWLVPEHTPAPRGEVRDAMNRRMAALLGHCEVHNVLEGTGLKTRILRSIITNLFLVSGYRGRMFVYGSLDDALRALSAKLARSQISFEEALAAVVAAGLR